MQVSCTSLKKVDTYRVSQLYYVDIFPKEVVIRSCFGCRLLRRSYGSSFGRMADIQRYNFFL